MSVRLSVCLSAPPPSPLSLSLSSPLSLLLPLSFSLSPSLPHPLPLSLPPSPLSLCDMHTQARESASRQREYLSMTNGRRKLFFLQQYADKLWLNLPPKEGACCQSVTTSVPENGSSGVFACGRSSGIVLMMLVLVVVKAAAAVAVVAAVVVVIGACCQFVTMSVPANGSSGVIACGNYSGIVLMMLVVLWWWWWWW